MQQAQDHHDDLPRAIAARLAAQDRAVSILTPAVDEAVAREARAHFALRRPRPSARIARRWAIPAAAAATVLVALFVLPPPGDLGPPALADDVDGSGRVDILDAFALARTRAADPGRVEQSELDALTARIVALDPPTEVL